MRGLDQRLRRITVDGQRQGGTGNPLDNIPPEIVQSLEVTKAFTPDMEADAVGGVINVHTGGTVIKDAYTQGRHQVMLNSLEPRPGTRNSITLGQPFRFFSDKRNASFLATGGFENQYKVCERVSTLRAWPAQVSPDWRVRRFRAGARGPRLRAVVSQVALRYEPHAGLLFRGSVTRSISRPNYVDLAPYRTLRFVHSLWVRYREACFGLACGRSGFTPRSECGGAQDSRRKAAPAMENDAGRVGRGFGPKASGLAPRIFTSSVVRG